MKHVLIAPLAIVLTTGCMAEYDEAYEHEDDSADDSADEGASSIESEKVDLGFTIKGDREDPASCGDAKKKPTEKFVFEGGGHVEGHDCPLEYSCVAVLITYCADNDGEIECDGEGCTCRIC